MSEITLKMVISLIVNTVRRFSTRMNIKVVLVSHPANPNHREGADRPAKHIHVRNIMKTSGLSI